MQKQIADSLLFEKAGPEVQNEWDAFVLSLPAAHLFQTHAWGEVSKMLGWEPSRFCVKKEGKIVAAAQVLSRRKGILALHYIPRGPLFTDRESFDLLMRVLKKEFRQGPGIELKINPAVPKSSGIDGWYREMGFVPSASREMHVATFRVNLSKSLDEIFEGMDSSVRRQIRKAEKAGVTVDSSGSPQAVKDFYTVYSHLSKEGKTATHSFEFIQKVCDVFSPTNQVRIFVAYFEGKPAAAELVFLHPTIGELMWVAHVPLEKNVGASHLVHWSIIQWLKDKGYDFYDLGGVPPDPDELPGIYFHKKNIGGEKVELAGEYELPLNPFLYFAWKKLSPFYLARRR